MVDQFINAKKAEVEVLETSGSWFGVTYPVIVQGQGGVHQPGIGQAGGNGAFGWVL